MTDTKKGIKDIARPIASDFSVAIIATRWNSEVVDSLVEAALETLSQIGIEDENVAIFRVPGAFELPLAARKAAEIKCYDAIICLGCVVRGETPHFDFVAGEAARGIGNVAADFGLPVSFGVLTTDTMEQAMDRAGGKHGNKGAEAANAAIDMIHVLRQLDRVIPFVF